jgi:hypothetical protein
VNSLAALRGAAPPIYLAMKNPGRYPRVFRKIQTLITVLKKSGV